MCLIALLFWVGISSFLKRKLPYLLFNVDMDILIVKALRHFYILLENLNNMLTWTYIIVFAIEGKHNLKLTTYT